MKPRDELGDHFRRSRCFAHFRHFLDDAKRFTELQKLLHALKNIERLELALAARNPLLKLFQQTLAPLLGAPVELSRSSRKTEHVVERASDSPLFDRFRAASAILDLWGARFHSYERKSFVD